MRHLAHGSRAFPRLGKSKSCGWTKSGSQIFGRLLSSSQRSQSLLYVRSRHSSTHSRSVLNHVSAGEAGAITFLTFGYHFAVAARAASNPLLFPQGAFGSGLFSFRASFACLAVLDHVAYLKARAFFWAASFSAFAFICASRFLDFGLPPLLPPAIRRPTRNREWVRKASRSGAARANNYCMKVCRHTLTVPHRRLLTFLVTPRSFRVLILSVVSVEKAQPIPLTKSRRLSVSLDTKFFSIDLDPKGPHPSDRVSGNRPATFQVESASARTGKGCALEQSFRERTAQMRTGIGEGIELALDIRQANRCALQVDRDHLLGRNLIC